jgi:hypothetical protein
MNEFAITGIIMAAQFSVTAVIWAVSVLVLVLMVIAINRLFHMFWIPTRVMQRIFGFINENGAAVQRHEPSGDIGSTKMPKKPL